MGKRARRASFATVGTLLFLVFAAPVALSQERRDCSDFDTQQEAQAFFTQNGGPQNDPFNLDVDNDGQACEGLRSGTGASPSPGASATASAAPTASPGTNTLPKNGAATTAMALSGLSFLEAGFGMTLAARSLGVRRRALPAYLMRKMIRAHNEGQSEVALMDNVYLVRKPKDPDPKSLGPLIVPLLFGDAPEAEKAPVEPVALTELDVVMLNEDLSMHPRSLSSPEPLWWESQKSSMSWAEWPFFTPPPAERPREDSNLRHPV